MKVANIVFSFLKTTGKTGRLILNLFSLCSVLIESLLLLFPSRVKIKEPLGWDGI